MNDKYEDHISALASQAMTIIKLDDQIERRDQVLEEIRMLVFEHRNHLQHIYVVKSAESSPITLYDEFLNIIDTVIH